MGCGNDESSSGSGSGSGGGGGGSWVSEWRLYLGSCLTDRYTRKELWQIFKNKLRVHNTSRKNNRISS